MIVTRKESLQNPGAGDPAFFDGTVRLARAVGGAKAGDIAVNLVSFEDGARTHWHTHGGGQVLHVVEGAGRAQRWGEAVHEIGPGDVVFATPGEKHWHGAAPGDSMSHLAVTLGRTEWMESVQG